MTDNQRRAIDRLSEYNDAKRRIPATLQKISELESKCNRVTKSCDSIMQETFVDGKFVTVPVVVQTSGGNSREGYLDALMDARGAYWQECIDAEKLCGDIEREISEKTKGRAAILLSLHFLHNVTLEMVCGIINHCYAQTKRLKWRALEEFGAKMSRGEP